MPMPFIPTKKTRSLGGASSAEYTGAGRTYADQLDSHPLQEGRAEERKEGDAGEGSLTECQKRPATCSSKEAEHNEHGDVLGRAEAHSTNNRQRRTVHHPYLSAILIHHPAPN